MKRRHLPIPFFHIVVCGLSALPTARPQEPLKTAVLEAVEYVLMEPRYSPDPPGVSGWVIASEGSLPFSGEIDLPIATNSQRHGLSWAGIAWIMSGSVSYSFPEEVQYPQPNPPDPASLAHFSITGSLADPRSSNQQRSIEFQLVGKEFTDFLIGPGPPTPPPGSDPERWAELHENGGSEGWTRTVGSLRVGETASTFGSDVARLTGQWDCPGGVFDVIGPFGPFQTTIVCEWSAQRGSQSGNSADYRVLFLYPRYGAPPPEPPPIEAEIWQKLEIAAPTGDEGAASFKVEFIRAIGGVEQRIESEILAVRPGVVTVRLPAALLGPANVDALS